MLLVCGPHLILSAALKRWGHPRQPGFWNHVAGLWAIATFFLRSNPLETPEAVGVM